MRENRLKWFGHMNQIPVDAIMRHRLRIKEVEEDLKIFGTKPSAMIF